MPVIKQRVSVVWRALHTAAHQQFIILQCPKVCEVVQHMAAHAADSIPAQPHIL